MHMMDNNELIIGIIYYLLLFYIGISSLDSTHAFQTCSTQHTKSPYLAAKVAVSSTSLVGTSRKKHVSKLKDWCDDDSGIQVASNIQIQASKLSGGLGLVTNDNSRSSETGSVVVTVPASLALSVELPGTGPDDSGVVADLVNDRSVFRSLPWYAQFSLYLLKLDKVSSCKQADDVDLQPWLDSLPRDFATPIHWGKNEREELQYSHLVESVKRQEIFWKDLHTTLQSCCRIENITWKDFLWGCEIARSRAFSGGYTGTSFNPVIYAFTLVLVTVYVALHLGTLEQAANGAALVFCASILQDFVLPKFFKTKKYVICPIIDMANHNSLRATANVAYEYFANTYSLSITSTVPSNSELFISYGTRSNDQLLQYYGFIEEDNPHDTYVMPPLRNWDIAALEKACGGVEFPPGRLQKLNKAGLLGNPMEITERISDENELASNPDGGVVLSRAVGVDPAVIQALRALVSTDEEWEQSGSSVGNFAAEVNPENESKARIAARTAIEMELSSKPTTIEMDRTKLSSKSELLEPDERMAIMFRIEKKKLLKETIDKLL